MTATGTDTVFVDFTDEVSCRACMVRLSECKMVSLFNSNNFGNLFTEFTSLQVSKQRLHYFSTFKQTEIHLLYNKSEFEFNLISS